MDCPGTFILRNQEKLQQFLILHKRFGDREKLVWRIINMSWNIVGKKQVVGFAGKVQDA